MSDPVPEPFVVAQGGLSRLKELRRDLSRAGVEGEVLPPADGCHGG